MDGKRLMAWFSLSLVYNSLAVGAAGVLAAYLARKADGEMGVLSCLR